MKKGKLSRQIGGIGTLLVTYAFLCSGCSLNDKSAYDGFVPYTPREGKAGIYLYGEASSLGALFLGDFYIDGVCVGPASEDGYYYIEVESKKEHVFSMSAEPTDADLTLEPAEGQVYFVKMRSRGGQTMWQPQLRFVGFDKQFFNSGVTQLRQGCDVSR